MTFANNLPQSADELVQRSKTDVQRELDKVNSPNRANVFLDASWLGAIPTANANRIFDYTLQLKEAIRLNMPDTTESEYADRWGSIYVGARTAAVGASGSLAATGTAGNTIPISTNYQSSDGIAYITTAAATLTLQSLSASIARVGTTATATTTVDHLIGSNVSVTISGSDQTEYNATFEIQVTGANTFTFEVAGSPTTPATGTILAGFTSASVPVEAVPPSDPTALFGSATNQTLDAPLSLTSAIAGVDSSANTNYSELAGGSDEEADDDYKARYVDKIRNPVSHYATPDIDQKIRNEVPGVTRTFIQKTGAQIGTTAITSINRFDVFAKVVTATPHGLFDGAEVTITGAVEVDYNVVDAPVMLIDATTFSYLVAGSPTTPATGIIAVSGVIPIGRVQTYFVRDLDDDPIPTAPEILDVKNAILEITPANTPDAYVIVSAPTALPVNFTFTQLVPDDPTMRLAVEANLQQFFNESVSVGQDIDEDAYRSAIFNTVDTQTGFNVVSFEVSAPSADISVAVGELPTLGTMDFTAL